MTALAVVGGLYVFVGLVFVASYLYVFGPEDGPVGAFFCALAVFLLWPLAFLGRGE